MKSESYKTLIEVNQSPEEVFKAINNVTKWWSKDFSGDSTKEFTIHHPDQHYSNQKVVESIPYEKIVWLVTESRLDWLKKDKEEWTNTKMVFEISLINNKTILHFTHEGLIPERECYNLCEQGWNIVITDWLYHYITVGKPSNEMDRALTLEIVILKVRNKKKTLPLT